MPYLLALDQGTSSSRALIINEKGRILHLSQKPLTQTFPQSGYVEQDAEALWRSQYEVACDALKQWGSHEKITALGISNQRETSVLWDRKTSTPLHPAIVWQDRRTSTLCQQLKPHEPLFQQKTGLLLDPYFSATKIRWMLDQIPGAQKRAEAGELAFGTIDSWLIWKLTKGKVHITDSTNASRTLLYNLHTHDWDPELLQLLHIPQQLLPEIRSSSEVYGTTAPGLFPSEIPISGAAGDQQAALFGQGCLTPGSVKATYGTGCFILMNIGVAPILSKQHLLTTLAMHRGSTFHYALEGSIFIAGAAIQWLRDNLGLIQKSSDIDDLAASVTDTEGVYFVPAFTGLGAPDWDPHARGTIVGLSRGTTRAHLARATLEGIAFQVYDLCKAMELDAGLPILELKVDGGAAASDPMLEMQANLIQKPILRPQTREVTALGAAYLAGLGIGLFQDLSEIQTLWTLERKFLPQKNISEKIYNWRRAVERSKEWA